MKKSILALVVLAVIAGGVFWWRNTSEASIPVEEAPTLATAKWGPIRQTVRSSGRIVSNLDVEIKCRASGEVLKLPFDISDRVKKDDLILELDPIEQQRAVDQAKASIAAAQARLAQANSNLLTAEATLVAERQRTSAAVRAAEARAVDAQAKAKREQELLEKKFSSPEEAETARTAAVQAEQDLQTARAALENVKAQELEIEARRQDIEVNKAQVSASEIELSLRQRQLTYTKVYSPIDGVVTARNVQIGQIISSGVTNVGGGTTVMVISDLSHIYILASVDESDIGEVQLGQSAEITVDAYPRQQFTGKVDRIAAKGVLLQNVVTFEVRIEVLSENKHLLKPEMTAVVDIVVAEKDRALLIPTNSIVREKRDTFVNQIVAKGGKPEQKPVEIGIQTPESTEVLSGLKEGDTVVERRPEEESRWRNEGSGSNDRRRQGMMMRTMGGGGATPGGRR